MLTTARTKAANIYIAVILSFALLLPNFFPTHSVISASGKADWDQFDPNLALRLQSVDDLLQYADSVAATTWSRPDTYQYAEILSQVVRKRFYHGYSHYSLKENWIASLMGDFFWDHLSAIVLPDDIMKHPMAACSQQSIVMINCFRKKKIDYRTVGFAHHFALEGHINGKWYFFDTNMEPDFNIVPRQSIADLKDKGELYRIYSAKLTPASLETMLANLCYGKLNAAPAPRASIFHLVTNWLSKTLWLIPLAAALAFFQKRRRYAMSRKKDGSLEEAVS